jgi:Putative regulator of cell autolysis
LILLLCGLIIVLCAVYDIVFFAHISELGYFLVMCLSYFVLAKWSTESYKSVGTLSESLKISDDKATAAEAAFMQAQIKPHFLFNTLNAIASFCDTDPPRAQKLIGNFSDYLRSSIDFKNPEAFVPIERELGFVRSYTDIEEARFGDNLRIEFDIDETAKVRVPMLSIQPLVENAVNHGLRKKGGGGTVTVTVKKAPDGVLVSVDDDGQGMPPEKVAALLAPGTNRGIGLWNIDMRLKKLFGNGLTIESAIGKGTRVSFIIPYEETSDD